MFPETESGSRWLRPLYPETHQLIPMHLCPRREADVKYLLFNELSKHGECYCEVSLAGGTKIDLVWIESDGQGGHERIIGIEIKTPSGLKSKAAHKLESQVEGYREQTVSDLGATNFVASHELTPADEVYLFDQVWIVVAGNQDRWSLSWRDDTPEDGWLKYNRATGRIEYEIDPLSERETICLDYEPQVGEAQLMAKLWEHYQSNQTLVAAESWISEPHNRRMRHGRVEHKVGKGQTGKKKDADLSVGKRQEVVPLTEASTIRGLEVKTSLNASVRRRLQEQLPVYRNSKMYSEVYLVVPQNLSHEAQKFLEAEYPDVGLLTVTLEDISVSHERQADRLELQKIPLGDCPGKCQKFAL